MNSNGIVNYRNPVDANFVPGGNNAGPRFEQQTATYLNLVVGTGLGVYTGYGLSTSLNPNSWYHVVAIRNGNNIVAYLNGVQVVGTTNTQWPSGFTNLTIGRGFANSPERWFMGDVANVQVYNTTLSSAQVSQLYQKGIIGSPLVGMGNVGWWPLNGNAHDNSGRGGNGATANIIYTQISAI